MSKLVMVSASTPGSGEDQLSSISAQVSAHALGTVFDPRTRWMRAARSGPSPGPSLSAHSTVSFLADSALQELDGCPELGAVGSLQFNEVGYRHGAVRSPMMDRIASSQPSSARERFAKPADPDLLFRTATTYEVVEQIAVRVGSIAPG